MSSATVCLHTFCCATVNLHSTDNWIHLYLFYLFYSIWLSCPSTTIYFAAGLFYDSQTPVSKTIETLPVKSISVVGSYRSCTKNWLRYFALPPPIYRGGESKFGLDFWWGYEELWFRNGATHRKSKTWMKAVMISYVLSMTLKVIEKL